MHIYHVVLPEVWETFRDQANYEAESLKAEGFIHCSFAHQLDAVLNRYYSGAQRVNILTVDPARLTSRLVEEPSTNGEIYPHIYGTINCEAIIEADERVIGSNSK